MKKEFYIGQPLISKNSQIKCKLVSKLENSTGCPYRIVFENGSSSYATHGELEPSTEFKFSEIIAGLEQGYFEVGTEFRLPSIDRVITVKKGGYGLYLERLSEQIFLISKNINSTWVLVEDIKEMTLEEIEAELGYKIKLKDNGGN